MDINRIRFFASVLLAVSGTSFSLHADTFGAGTNQFTISFTSIGNPGNAADTNGSGAVSYSYRIGTYDISQNQINAAVANGLQGMSAGAWSGNLPAANITWFQAAAFVNYLDTSAGYSPAYNLIYTNGNYTMSLWQSWQPGYNSLNQFRNSLAEYFLPSVDEWYKAAFYDPKKNGGAGGYWLYSTGSNTVPTAVASGTNTGTAVYNQSIGQGPASVYQAGGLSPYGTMGQGGNVFQQLETSAYGASNTNPTYGRAAPGDFWDGPSSLLQSSAFASGVNPAIGSSSDGFRVASVPEPSMYALSGFGVIALVIAFRRCRTLITSQP